MTVVRKKAMRHYLTHAASSRRTKDTSLDRKTFISRPTIGTETVTTPKVVSELNSISKHSLPKTGRESNAFHEERDPDDRRPDLIRIGDSPGTESLPSLHQTTIINDKVRYHERRFPNVIHSDPFRPWLPMNMSGYMNVGQDLNAGITSGIWNSMLETEEMDMGQDVDASTTPKLWNEKLESVMESAREGSNIPEMPHGTNVEQKFQGLTQSRLLKQVVSYWQSLLIYCGLLEPPISVDTIRIRWTCVGF